MLQSEPSTSDPTDHGSIRPIGESAAHEYRHGTVPAYVAIGLPSSFATVIPLRFSASSL